MAKKDALKKTTAAKSSSLTRSDRRIAQRQTVEAEAADRGYAQVLENLTQAIHASRHRALTTVNRELVHLYFHIGFTIVEKQENANWGDSVVEQLAEDLRLLFPDIKGLSLPNIWRMRQCVISCREIDQWLLASAVDAGVGTACRKNSSRKSERSTASRVSMLAGSSFPILSTVSRELESPDLITLISRLSWSQHTEILTAVGTPAERWFYMQMSVRERWSVRELRQQIEADLFTRYVSVRSDPEKCLPDDAESGSIATYQTTLPDEIQIRRRLEQFPQMPEDDE